MPRRTCSVVECGNPHDARGFCRVHYGRWKRYGDPLKTTRKVSGIIGNDAARFWFFVERRSPDECWLWTGTTVRPRRAYGCLGVQGRMVLAHRFSYELAYGPIPAGCEVDHVWARGCRSRLCVNPSHLEAVTPTENKRRVADKMTHCPLGHPYDAVNTYVRPSGRGRGCLICIRSRAKERQAKIRASNLAKGLTTKGTVRVS